MRGQTSYSFHTMGWELLHTTGDDVEATVAIEVQHMESQCFTHGYLVVCIINGRVDVLITGKDVVDYSFCFCQREEILCTGDHAAPFHSVICTSPTPSHALLGTLIYAADIFFRNVHKYSYKRCLPWQHALPDRRRGYIFYLDFPHGIKHAGIDDG